MKKASKMKAEPTNLQKQLEQLKQLKPEELRKQWQTLFGSNPPPRIRSSLMVQAIARRLQEKALGGIKPSTQRGERLTPSHAVKGNRRYRYYVSRSLLKSAAGQNASGWRIPALEIE
jgi:DUF2924 family protein